MRLLGIWWFLKNIYFVFIFYLKKYIHNDIDMKLFQFDILIMKQMKFE